MPLSSSFFIPFLHVCKCSVAKKSDRQLVEQRQLAEGLKPWQEQIWKDDHKILFVVTSTVNEELGCFANQGNTSRFSQEETHKGYNNPIEFYWRKPGSEKDHPYPDRIGMKLFYYEVEDVGPGTYSLRPRAAKGISITVRELDGRWIGIVKIYGRAMALQYWYVKVRYVPRPKLSSLEMYGFRIDNCKIDYDKEEKLTWKEGVSWELFPGEDPACECEPNPTCSSDSDASQVNCSEALQPLLRKHVEGIPSYKSFVEDLPEEFSDVKETYGDLLNSSVSVLPPTCPANETLQRPLMACMESLTYELFIAHEGYYPNTGHQRYFGFTVRRLRRLQHEKAFELLDGPRKEYVRCLEREGRLYRMAEIERHTEKAMNNLRNELEGIVSHGHDYDSEASDQGESMMSFIALGISLVTLLLMCCIVLRMLCKGTKHADGQNAFNSELELPSVPVSVEMARNAAGVSSPQWPPAQRINLADEPRMSDVESVASTVYVPPCSRSAPVGNFTMELASQHLVGLSQTNLAKQQLTEGDLRQTPENGPQKSRLVRAGSGYSLE